MPLLKSLKKGELFKRKSAAKAIYQKGHYDRGSKTYCCSDVEDMNREIFIKGDKEVFVEFEY